MAFCPSCHAEYQAWVRHCADCDTELVAELPAEPHAWAGHSVVEIAVARVPTAMQADMYAELLKGEGIIAVVVPLGPGAGAWGSSFLLPHELRVAADEAARARALLSQWGYRP